MKPTTSKEFLTSLLMADNEEAVVALLKKSGYWDDPAVWRNYGDMPNNSAAINNQSASAIAALAEKVTNSFDAVLFNQARLKKVPMSGPMAPQNVAQAVERFILDGLPDPELKQIQDLPSDVRKEWQDKIAITVTGSKSSPSVSIVDQGEGQTPSAMPHTFLSLISDNKVKVPFAHGKFNMGGSGVLPFCSPNHNLLLTLTRRNPDLLDETQVKPEDYEWGFTIVRRQLGADDRSSSYRYLAPVGSDLNPGKGEVLSFAADQMDLMPEKNDPYKLPVRHGTLIKLYEYQMPAKYDAIQPRGLLGRLEEVLPTPALPFRIFECRNYSTHADWMECRGAVRRLRDNADTRLEPGFPIEFPLIVKQERFNVAIYATKEQTRDMPFGVCYTVNGQAHDQQDSRFFTRDFIRLDYLQKSLLVVVDCSHVSVRGLEQLFLNSRDRTRDSEFTRNLTENLVKAIGENDILKKLNAERRNRVLNGSVDDGRGLAESVQEIIQNLPGLAFFLQPRERTKNPLMPKAPEVLSYEGHYFPTFFQPKAGKGAGFEGTERTASPDARIKWFFETDAVNDYFTRQRQPGAFTVAIVNEASSHSIDNVLGPVLKDGECYVSFKVPEDFRNQSPLQINFSVADPSGWEPFTHSATLSLREQTSTPVPPGGPPKPPKSPNPPKKSAKGRIDIPMPIYVKRKDWSLHTPPFTARIQL